MFTKLISNLEGVKQDWNRLVFYTISASILNILVMVGLILLLKK